MQLTLTHVQRPCTHACTRAAYAHLRRKSLQTAGCLLLRPRHLSGFVRHAAQADVAQQASGDAEPDQRAPYPLQATQPSSYTETNAAVKPGEADAAKFRLDASVEFWKTFNAAAYRTVDAPPQDRMVGLSQVQDMLTDSEVLADLQSAAYWMYHLGRTGYFAGNAVLAVVAEELSRRVGGLSSSGPQASSSSSSSSTQPGPSMLSRLLQNAEQELAFRMLEVVGMYKQDLGNIKAGAYKLPWDMTTLTHRQYNPLFALRKSVDFVDEARLTLTRRANKTPDSLWLQSPLYPSYYLNSFHYQSDGWMSSRSARVYETSTEVLFFGRQDAMQRSALVPLHLFMQGRRQLDTTLLEVAAGTGRFHTFIKDNYPDMPTIVSDLSPFYLSQAQDNLRYWRDQRQPGKPLGSTFLQCAAEQLALPDASVDVVVSVYLFHELPRAAQEAAVQQMYRVLKPGGLLVLSDSVQLGDRGEAWDRNMGSFGNFNEPFYRDYIALDLGDLFERAGFICGTKSVASSTKTLSFTKPE